MKYGRWQRRSGGGGSFQGQKTRKLLSAWVMFPKAKSFKSKLYVVLSNSASRLAKSWQMRFTFLRSHSKCGGRWEKDEAVLMNSVVLKREKGKLPTKDTETIKRLIFHCYCKLPFCLLSFQPFISHQLMQLGKTSHCTNRCRPTQIAWPRSVDRDLFLAAPQVLSTL